LNRNLLLNLEHIGVPRQVFLQLLDHHVRNLGAFYRQPQNYQRILQRELSRNYQSPVENSIELPLAERALELHFKRTKTATEKHDLQKAISTLFRDAILELRNKLHITVPHSRLLFGVLDPSLLLSPGQVFVRVNGETLKGPIIVSSMNPLLPEELRKLQAVDIPELNYLSDVVVFSQKNGARDFYDAGGTHLDGTKYWVSWEPDFVKCFTKNRPPASFPEHIESQTNITQSKDICEAALSYMFDSSATLERIRLLLIAHAEKSGLNSPSYLTLARLHRLVSDSFVTGQTVSVPPELFKVEFPSYLGIPQSSYSPDTASGDLYLAANMHIRRIGYDPKAPTHDTRQYFPLDDEVDFLTGDGELVDTKHPIPRTALTKKSVIRRRYRLPYEIGTAPVHHEFTLEEARQLEDLAPTSVKEDPAIKSVVDYERDRGRLPVVIAQPGIDIISFAKDSLFPEKITESDQIRIRVKTPRNLNRRMCDKYEYFLALEYEEEFQIYLIESDKMTIFKNVADQLAEIEFTKVWAKEADHVVSRKLKTEIDLTKKRKTEATERPVRSTKQRVESNAWPTGKNIIVNPPPDHHEKYWLAQVQSYSDGTLVVRWFDRIGETARFRRAEAWATTTDTIVVQSVYEDLIPELRQVSKDPKEWLLVNEAHISATVTKFRP